MHAAIAKESPKETMIDHHFVMQWRKPWQVAKKKKGFHKNSPKHPNQKHIMNLDDISSLYKALFEVEFAVSRSNFKP